MDDLQRNVITHLLTVPFDGAAELREQLAVARVVGDWSERAASFDISVPGNTRTAQISDGIAPVNAFVADEEGAYTAN
jgi:hypothetical protein